MRGVRSCGRHTSKGAGERASLRPAKRPGFAGRRTFCVTRPCCEWRVRRRASDETGLHVVGEAQVSNKWLS
nr:MAG: hypothetical protein DIU78_00505 [Pseudomonadota bacterium]